MCLFHVPKSNEFYTATKGFTFSSSFNSCIMRINKEKNCCCYYFCFAYKASCSDGFRRPATGHMNCEAKVQIQLILVPQPGFNSAPLTLHPAGKSGLINKCFLIHLCSLNIWATPDILLWFGPSQVNTHRTYLHIPEKYNHHHTLEINNLSFLPLKKSTKRCFFRKLQIDCSSDPYSPSSQGLL